MKVLYFKHITCYRNSHSRLRLKKTIRNDTFQEIGSIVRFTMVCAKFKRKETITQHNKLESK